MSVVQVKATLSTCSVIAFHKHIEVFTYVLQTMTGRAYMGEVLIQV